MFHCQLALQHACPRARLFHNKTPKANGISNVFLARMASEDFAEAMRGRQQRHRLKGLTPWDELRLRTVLVDPPRAGLDTFTIKVRGEGAVVGWPVASRAGTTRYCRVYMAIIRRRGRAHALRFTPGEWSPCFAPPPTHTYMRAHACTHTCMQPCTHHHRRPMHRSAPSPLVQLLAEFDNIVYISCNPGVCGWVGGCGGGRRGRGQRWWGERRSGMWVGGRPVSCVSGRGGAGQVVGGTTA